MSSASSSFVLRTARLYRSYGVRGLVRLCGDATATRLTFPQAKLLRRPFYIRGRRWIHVGAGFITGPGLRMDAFPSPGSPSPLIRIGTGVQMNDYVHIAAVCSVHIGDRVLIASRVFITDHNHGRYRGQPPHDSPLTPPAERLLVHAPVSVGDDVWIGECVSILPGVTIGRGAVIGTMTTVTADVPAYTMAVGSPSRCIKRYNFATSRWDAI